MNISIRKEERVAIVDGKRVPFKPGMTGTAIQVSQAGVVVDQHQLVNGEWVLQTQTQTGQKEVGLWSFLRSLLFG